MRKNPYDPITQPSEYKGFNAAWPPVVSEPVSTDWWEGVLYALEYVNEELGFDFSDSDLYNEALAGLGENE